MMDHGQRVTFCIGRFIFTRSLSALNEPGESGPTCVRPASIDSLLFAHVGAAFRSARRRLQPPALHSHKRATGPGAGRRERRQERSGGRMPPDRIGPTTSSA